MSDVTHAAAADRPLSSAVEACRFGGRRFSEQELHAIIGMVSAGGGASRRQLSIQVCVGLGWLRPTGALKIRECRDLLELLECQGYLRLPAKRIGRPAGAQTRIVTTGRAEPGAPLEGSVGQFEPLALQPVATAADHRLCRELIARYHYLGYRVPFGAHLGYLVYAGKPQRRLVGAVQISSPAWRLAVRDRWIGWDEPSRLARLQRVVNNSRFLILPWIHVRNLASRALSLLLRRLQADWQARYAVLPLLVETMVDPSRHRGTCYRAANWIDLGLTSGRGRMDRAGVRAGQACKHVLVYPLVPDAARRLAERVR